MKAAVLFANEDIRFTDFETPEIKSGCVKIKVKVSGICGSDIPRVLSNGAHFYPVVLGHEFSGEVVEIADDVSGFEIGGRVSVAPLVPCLKCADCQNGNYSLCKHYSFIGSRQPGSFSEYVVVPAINAVKFSDDISFETGAMFEPSTVALHGIFQNKFSGGENVAVLGGGTIGIFTAQWAKILGAGSVTVFDISDERLALAKDLGADYTVNTLDDNCMKTVAEITNQNGFGYVFETAGVTTTMQLAFELAGNKARVCFIGTPTKDITFTPKLWENMNRKEFYLTGSWMSYSAPFPGKEWEMTARYFKTGQLRFDERLIFKKYPLSKASEAFSLFKTPGAVKGKILLVSDEA